MINYRWVMILTLGILAMLPSVGQAQTIDLDSVSPNVDEDITPPDNAKAGEENFYTFWLKGQIDETYTATFNVSEEPAFTFVSGGDMTLEDNISYNADTNEFTVVYTAKALQQIDSQSSLELEDNQTLTIVAVSFPVEDGSGPGEATIGSWVATAFQEWILTTPSESNNAMGATVQGDGGDKGHFKMFMPATTLNEMADYANEDTYTTEDLALYKDNTASAVDVQAVTGGAFVDFTTTLPEEDGPAQFKPQDGGPGVSQSLKIQPIKKSVTAPITLKITKDSVKAGGYVKLFGKVTGDYTGKKITLWRRFEDTKFKRFATVMPKTNGKFSRRVKINRNVMFKAKFMKKFSDPVSVQVKE